MAASRAAQKRLTREYKTISENPPPYITAHPSDSNILEWHYIITGPEDTPYHGGQYWGTLMFPPDYPFAPPAIRMHTPSGRFQPSTRLCLSISDFHPRSFNPAWEVSTILIGLLSFMTSEEMTTGSVSATEAERKFHAARSRWWNSTCGGSQARSGGPAQKGNLKSGDGGAKFRGEWPEVDQENWAWIKTHRIDATTGARIAPPPGPAVVAGGSSPGSSASLAGGAACRPQLGMASAGGAGGVGGSGTQAQAVVDAVRQGRGAGQGWLARNKFYLVGGAVFVYVLLARLLGGDQQRSN
ncbi:ubiquitin-conjugating enzyme [Grosmannia clavigera kw1407]|uniref:Ubiquitin-conjugating enzyme n=1 Tax=Grosmannia clavigera (strain kw1407 / UAMH 11150) TaxID=655863 RepID=F0XP61_GROCL|nr:ubiquitin-conjugating enzyme [Grosmannia clavigera kw1407]EFX00474.1 ubiquitin-conjugating enzyme [Grosmannia clavigera kw1407]